MIMSERQLEIGSFPFVEQVESTLARFNDEVQAETNMVGHIFVEEDEVEVTAGFAGAKGNLMWFNSGKTDLLCRLVTGKLSKSVVLEPGYGFCLGKRERYTKVYLSSFERASHKFSEDVEMLSCMGHALFFGCDSAERKSWLKELDSKKPAAEYQKMVRLLCGNRSRIELEKERNFRLGVEVSNIRRNQIRIAPVMGSNLGKGLLSEKILGFEKWIKDTLSQVKSAALPSEFTIQPVVENPQVGEPFDVLWVKFEFDDNVWDDEVI